MTAGTLLRKHIKNNFPGGIVGFLKKSKLSRGYFFYNVNKAEIEEEFLRKLSAAGIDVKKILEQEPMQAGQRSVYSVTGIEYPVPLKNGRRAVVIMPQDHSREDFEKVIKVLQVYKE